MIWPVERLHPSYDWPVGPLHHGPVPSAGGGEWGAQAAGARALVAVAQIAETQTSLILKRIVDEKHFC